MPSSSDPPAEDADLLSQTTVLRLLNAADLAFVRLTSDGDVVAANAEFESLTGRSLEAVRGAPFTDLLATVPSPLESVLDASAEDGESLAFVVPIRTASGDVVPCKAHLAATGGRDDGAVALLLSRQSNSSLDADGRDRLDPERVEETAAKAFVALADALSDGIIVLDTASEIQYANPAVERILGYSPDELVGGSKLSIIPERLRENHLSALSRYLETGERNIDWEYVELPGQHADGHEVPLGISLNDFVFEGDRYFVGLFRDISPRKEAEEALRDRERRLEELIEELEASNERLEQFAYAASHDLQEPLRMVSSYLQLIERRYADELDEDGREFIDYAVDGADRMREMIEGLLEYSRVESRGDPFEAVDLDDVLAEVRDDLQMKITESGAEITAGPLPTVRADRGQMRQVFQNLLDNAIEYSGDERPRVHVAAERCNGPDAPDTDDDWWRISVADEGVGIDADDAGRVFEVFQRLHSQADHEGTGIGLALCRRIVERHGGAIRVESDPGEGSTFRFTLPAG
ncbi:sensor histidine kinase [Halomicrobium urmianum]|uniref:sensor histidine kinase n=1 Tax=Halomicrobium urmianum TaxID=1586233 RepID=UPI001CDA4032|nr:ATP-binding protein [Halomicrobium urmianum]